MPGGGTVARVHLWDAELKLPFVNSLSQGSRTSGQENNAECPKDGNAKTGASDR